MWAMGRTLDMPVLDPSVLDSNKFLLSFCVRCWSDGENWGYLWQLLPWFLVRSPQSLLSAGLWTRRASHQLEDANRHRLDAKLRWLFLTVSQTFASTRRHKHKRTSKELAARLTGYPCEVSSGQVEHVSQSHLMQSSLHVHFRVQRKPVQVQDRRFSLLLLERWSQPITKQPEPTSAWPAAGWPSSSRTSTA